MIIVLSGKEWQSISSLRKLICQRRSEVGGGWDGRQGVAVKKLKKLRARKWDGVRYNLR